MRPKFHKKVCWFALWNIFTHVKNAPVNGLGEILNGGEQWHHSDLNSNSHKKFLTGLGFSGGWFCLWGVQKIVSEPSPQ